MSKKSRRASRRNQPTQTGAFGNSPPPLSGRTSHAANAQAETCPYPYLFNSKNRCCMCRGKTSSCPCTAQDAIDHYMHCHIADNCEGEGHPSVFQMISMGIPTPTVSCRNCGEIPTFGEVPTFRRKGMSNNLGPDDRYGLPPRTTRQWITENSEPDEFGTVPIPADRQDGLCTHATYWPDCDHFCEPCECSKDENVIWVLEEYSG